MGGGGGTDVWGHVSPDNWFWGLHWGQKSMFFTQENVAFIQLLIYQSQSIPASNEKMMKTKVCTLACSA